MIIIRGIVRHWEIKKILDDLNEMLLQKKYNPLYYFEGTPSIEEGGMIVTIKLSRELSTEDMILVRKLMEINGLKVVESQCSTQVNECLNIKFF